MTQEIENILHSSAAPVYIFYTTLFRSYKMAKLVLCIAVYNIFLCVFYTIQSFIIECCK